MKHKLSTFFGIVVVLRRAEVCLTNIEVYVKQHQMTTTTLFLLVVSLMMFAYGVGSYQSKSERYETAQNIQDSLITVSRRLADAQKLFPKTLNEVTFTSYNPVKEQTNEDPFITASGDSVDEWTLAVSRDMLKKHHPDGIYAYNDTVYAIIPLIVRDTMNKRYEKRADILSFSMEISKLFGKRKGYLAQF